MNENEQIHCSAKFIAELFGVTVRRIQQLTQDGIIGTIEVGKRRKYNLAQTVRAYIDHLKVKASNQDKSSEDARFESEKLEAEARIKKAKAEIAELELDEISGKLHNAEDVEAVMTDNILRVRSALLAMPGRLAKDVVNADTPSTAAEIIKTECYAILNDLADYEYDPSEFQRRVRERRGWDDHLGADTSDDQ